MLGFQQESDFPFDLSGAIPTQLRNRIKWGLAIVVLVVAFVLVSFLRSVYTDLLWFGELGFTDVYLRVLFTRISLFVGGAILFGLFLGISLFFANRVSRGPEEVPLPQATREFLKGLIFWGTIGGVLLLSVVFGSLAANQWEIFLKAASGVSFGLTDPVFSKDASFYVFSLPVFDFLQGWLLGASIVILLASLGLYFVRFSFRGVGFLITPGLKVHVSIVAAVIMLVLGLGHWVDRWGLLLSEQGIVFGVSYSDDYARQHALSFLTVIAFASSLLILVNGYIRGIRLLVGGVALWIVAAIVLGNLWPFAVQRFTVNPNEFTKEKKYIERNIDFTREGFGLGQVAVQSYDVEPSLTSEMIAESPGTIANVRLWDQDPLSDVYRFEARIRPYYGFEDVDVDRYVVDGRYRQVMLAAREVNLDEIAEGDPDSQTWINKRLRYTHGFGIAMSPVTEFTPDGTPEFFANDLPAGGVIAVRSQSQTTEPETVIDEPRVYYGEKTTDYVLVNTNTAELDYQAGEGLQSINYEGTGGVRVGRFLRRLAYAWQFTDLNILITGEITDQSRVQYRREIQERVSTVAPFLLLDEDPYIVAAEGRLFWVQDAYTSTDHYPYSDPNPLGFNYIRNSVKVTIDASDGTLRFYVWDPSDPLVRTYQRIFPSLFVSKDAMPPSLQAHMRYPQDLFGFQAAKYLKYHMDDPEDFYNLEDIWSIPNEKFGQSGELQAVDPYYVIMKIPGEEREEFVLLLPYNRNPTNPILAGWLAARNDGANYGQLVAFTFPKERQVDGPEQIEARIDIDQSISEWFTLRCQEGSFCIRGNLLVVPLGGSLLYVEPVYLQAEGIDFPQLKGVILASGEKVVMEDSLEEALVSLTGFSSAAARVPAGEQAALPTETPTEAGSLRAEIERLAEGLNQLKESLSTIDEALQRLMELTGGE